MIDKCNVKCIMCGGDYFKSKSGRMITLEKFKTMAANLKLENACAIVLAGAGDPLLNRDLVRIIQFVRHTYPHITISVTTNGLALTAGLSGLLLDSGVSLLNISINSATRASYRRIMQVDGFDTVCRNAKAFVEQRTQSGSPTALQFSAAINRLNIEDLPRLVELTREVGGNSINLFYTRFYPERIRHLNIDDPSDRLENNASLFFHQQLSDEMVQKAKTLARQYRIHLTHEPLFQEHVPPCKCTWPVSQLMVGFDGEIYPCGGSEVHFREKVEKGIYRFGNALQSPVDAYWNNEIYRTLRISSRQGDTCLVSECKCCANTISPNDIRSHIMQWDEAQCVWDGEALFSMGDLHGAMDAFSKAIDINPDYAQAYDDLGVVYWKLGDNESALKNFKKACELNPDDHDAVINLGDLYKISKRMDEARDTYRAYLTHHPNDSKVSNALADLGPEIHPDIPNRTNTAPPLVSVIVPTFNRPEMLKETLKSILDQTYATFEIIVVNDYGEDVSNVVNDLNPRGNIRYIRHETNKGLAAARNTGIKSAKGKYIAYLDDDDMFFPDHLQTLVDLLGHSEFKVAYTDAFRAHQKKVNGRYVVVKRDVPYSFDFDYDRILTDNFVPVLCFMHEKSCLDEVGLFDEELTTQEDWDLWIRMSRKFKFAHIPKVTCEFNWREDGTTMTGAKKMDFLQNTKRIFEKYREYSKDKPESSRVQETFLKLFNERVQREYDGAQYLIEERREEEAILALEKLLSLSPAHSLAHDDLGVLYFHRGDKERALGHFLQSLQADPKNQNAMKNLADLQMELGQMEEALQLYQRVLADQPMDVEGLLGVGNVCLRAGRPEDAKFFYTRVLEIEPGNNVARQGLENLGSHSSDAQISERTDDSVRDSIIAEKIPKLVSIIILVHNQLEYTRKCLDSIFNCTHEPFELIVVDNGSTDGTKEYLNSLRQGKVEVGGWKIRVEEDGKVSGEKGEETAPRAHQGKRKNRKEKGVNVQRPACRRFEVVQNKENLGFAAGNNQGMAVAKEDYILLMNNDVVVTPGWLGFLFSCAEQRSKIGIVGPMTNYISGPQHVEKVAYDIDSLTHLNQFSQEFHQEHRGQCRSYWRVVGFFMLIKRAVVETIGGLDERYGLGNFEDDDFCIRAALANFESWIAEDCFVHHFGSRTFAGANIDYKNSLQKNWEIFKKKWGVPSDVAYGEGYQLESILQRGFSPLEHYCPLTPQGYSIAGGEKLFGLGDIEGAKNSFEQILRSDPNHIEALNNLGVIAFQQKEIDRAISCFTRVLESDETYFEATENLGKCMVANQKYEEALHWFRRALELKPDDVELLNALANCFIQIEDFARAEETYTRSCQLDRNQPVVGKILAELEKMKALQCQRRITP
jgi:GT2 family glycosyltransferase/Flp pilus assembly protein TadD/MoaA/NifB/PqqE/SkfB family radical SAM enzyme